MKTTLAFHPLLGLVLVASLSYVPTTPAPPAPAGCRLGGLLLDAATHEPIPQAHVVLLRTADNACVATTTTHTDGTFGFGRVPAGCYRLRPLVLGYAPAAPLLRLSARQPVLHLGVLPLEPWPQPAAATQPAGLRLPSPAGVSTKVGNASRFVLTHVRPARPAAF